MEERLNEKLWTVVEFTSEHSTNEISTVPVQWLLNGDDEQLLCAWPKSKIRKNIKQAVSPQEDWERWAVKKLSKANMTYLEALQLEKKKVEVSGTDSDILNEDVSRKRKINKKKDANFVTDYDSSTEETLIPPPPKITTVERNIESDDIVSKKKQINQKRDASFVTNYDSSTEETFISPPLKIRTVAVVERNIESDDTASLASGDLMPPPHVMPSPSVSPIKHVIEKSQISVNSLDNTDLASLESPEGTDVDQTTENSFSPIDEDLHKKINKILDTVVANRILLERIAQGTQHKQSSKIINNFDCVPKTQFKKHKELMEYEARVTSSEEAQQQLEMAFFLCGGSEYENVKRGLKRIFHDKLARKCSWFGRKINFRIGNLKIIEILKVAVRKNFPRLSDQEFQKYVSAWFRQASLRYQRSKRADKK